MTTTPPGRVPSEDGHGGWFSYEPTASSSTHGHDSGNDDDPVIRVVMLRSHEHAGPFWDDEGHISDDYDELRRWIGISRALFEDAMAWNDRFAATGAGQLDAGWSARHLATRRQLTHRLRREVHPDIDVEEDGQW